MLIRIKHKLQRTTIEMTAKEFYKAMDKSLKEYANITVGVHADAHDYPDGTSSADVAMWNEYGTDTIPARYWLRGSLAKERPAVTRAYQKNLERNYKYPAAFKNAQIAMANDLITQIINHVENNTIGMQGNEASTIRKKGGDQPMVATGHLLRQLDWKFET